MSQKLRINAGWPAEEASRMDKKHPFFLGLMTQASSLLDGCWRQPFER